MKISQVKIVNPGYVVVELHKRKVSDGEIRTNLTGYDVIGTIYSMREEDIRDDLKPGMNVLLPKLRGNIFEIEGRKLCHIYKDEIIVGFED